jgi:nucleotide-binding universal stress UspA family protein
VDLIVTGRHKRGTFEELYGGSETLEILERTSTPVLVYKYMLPSGKVNERPFERPLLTMDWSPASEKAVEYLLSFKGVLKKVIAVHVIGEKEFKSPSAMEIQSLRKENKQKLEEVCSRFEKEGIEAESHLYVGSTFEQIEKAASEREATMIVAGTTGKSPLKEMLLGSVATKLTKHSVLPSLLVPASVTL